MPCTAATSDGAVGGDDLDRARELVGRRAVEEASVRQHDVGQQVPVARRAAVRASARRDVGAGEEAGDADVAAEELVGDHEERDVGAAPRSRASGTSGSSTSRTQLAGDDP